MQLLDVVFRAQKGELWSNTRPRRLQSRQSGPRVAQQLVGALKRSISREKSQNFKLLASMLSYSNINTSDLLGSGSLVVMNEAVDHKSMCG